MARPTNKKMMDIEKAVVTHSSQEVWAHGATKGHSIGKHQGWSEAKGVRGRKKWQELILWFSWKGRAEPGSRLCMFRTGPSE
jgi:hypothetical protein